MATPEIKHDLCIQFGNEYGPEEEQAVIEVLRKNAPTSGAACVRFEKELRYCGTNHAVRNNGTAAVPVHDRHRHQAGRPGRPPLTWIATAQRRPWVRSDLWM